MIAGVLQSAASTEPAWLVGMSLCFGCLMTFVVAFACRAARCVRGSAPCARAAKIRWPRMPAPIKCDIWVVQLMLAAKGGAQRAELVRGEEPLEDSLAAAAELGAELERSTSVLETGAGSGEEGGGAGALDEGCSKRAGGPGDAAREVELADI